MKAPTPRPLSPESPDDELQQAKTRLRQAAQEAGPSALVRRHPWSCLLGTVTGAFALTAIVKLFAERPVVARSNGFSPSASSRRSRTSVSGPLLQSLLHMGLPIIQSQFIRLLNQRHREPDSARTERPEPNRTKDRTHAVG